MPVSKPKDNRPMSARITEQVTALRSLAHRLPKDADSKVAAEAADFIQEIALATITGRVVGGAVNAALQNLLDPKK